jgi:hypothetical protein
MATTNARLSKPLKRSRSVAQGSSIIVDSGMIKAQGQELHHHQISAISTDDSEQGTSHPSSRFNTARVSSSDMTGPRPFSPPMPSMSFELPCPVLALDELFLSHHKNTTTSHHHPRLNKANVLGTSIREGGGGHEAASSHHPTETSNHAPLGRILARRNNNAAAAPPSDVTLSLFDFLDDDGSNDVPPTAAPSIESKAPAEKTSIVDQLTFLLIPSLGDLSVAASSATTTAASCGGGGEALHRSSTAALGSRSSATATRRSLTSISAKRKCFAQWMKHVIEDVSDHYLSGVQAAKFFDPIAVDNSEGFAAVVALLDTSHSSSSLWNWNDVLQRRNDEPRQKTSAQPQQKKVPNRLVVGLCIGKQLSEAQRAEAASGDAYDDANANDDKRSASTSSADDWASSATRLSEHSLRGSIICGVEIMWVLEPLRRCGIATALVHEMRKHLVYGGFEIPVNAVAFSQPTRDGKQFAASFSGRKDFYTFV